MLIFIRLNQKKFNYFKELPSNSIFNKRNTLFQQEVLELLQDLPQTGYTVMNLFSNIGVVELIVDKETISTLMTYEKVESIKSIKAIHDD